MPGCTDDHTQALRLAACEAELAALRAQHAALVGSLSWRVTAPLRVVRILPRRLLDALDFRLRNDLPWDAQPALVRRLRRLPWLGPRLVRRELIRRYAQWHGRAPMLYPPRSFNEHLLHRMLHDDDPRLRQISDKLRMREVVAEAVGPGLVVPLLGAWNTAEAVPWDSLPVPCVIKPSHSCGQVAVLHTAADRDPARLVPLARRWLATDYFDVSLERGYRDLPRRLLAEPLLRGPDGGPPAEAQVLAFGGRPALIRVMTGAKGTPTRRDNWFHPDGRRAALRMNTTPGEYVLPRETAHRLCLLAARLAAGFAHLRVDFYLTESGPKVGELTPYMLGGSGRFVPRDWDDRLGLLWAKAAARGG
jgi:hypothetical protein